MDYVHKYETTTSKDEPTRGREDIEWWKSNASDGVVKWALDSDEQKSLENQNNRPTKLEEQT